jgi:amidase
MKMACESLDTIGVFARTVDDAALLVGGSAMRAIDVPVTEKPKLGVCRSPMWSHMTREGIEAFEAGVKRLAQAGAAIVERELPREFDELDALRFKLQAYEIARNLAHEVAHYRSQFSAVLLEAIDAGAKVPHAEYVRAQEFADARRRQLADHMRDLDALLTPSATGEAPLGLQSTGDTAMNRLWTLMHGPCVTVPAGRGAAGMPVGLQFYGLPWADSRTLGVARWAEGALGR